MLIVTWGWEGKRITGPYHLFKDWSRPLASFQPGENMRRVLHEPLSYELNHLPPRLSDHIVNIIGLSEQEFAESIHELTLNAHVQMELPPTAKRLVDAASAVAVEPESYDEWRSHLQELADTGTQLEVVRFLIGIVYAGLHSRVSWLARRAVRPGVRVLCWGLRSQARTWAALSALLLWSGLETAADTGVGAAILVVLAAFSALVWLVERLRNRYGAHPPRSKKTPPE